MRTASTILTVLVLGATLALATAAAVWGGDWPGWDEGWALIAFPLGVPAAASAGIAASLRSAARPAVGRLSLGVSVAVWLWGASVFVLWYALP